MEPRTWVLAVFLLITLLSALAVLAAAVGWLPGAAPELIKWGIPAVLGEIVATVLVFFKGQWAQSLRINIVFQGTEASDLILDGKNCRYTVFDLAGDTVREGKLGPTLGHGGWQIELPFAVQSQHSVSLTLRSHDNRNWHVRPFLPLVQTQVARPE
ncbi:MAG: hypothetical protein HY646_00815 [Acidobacteria bacterium]|nr:hypothetical protein [Acidobacteriota bacterium]